MEFTSPSLSAAALTAARRAGISAERCQALAASLSAAVAALGRRRASDVPDGHLDDYVALRWMSWQAGALVLTSEGEAIEAASLGSASA